MTAKLPIPHDRIADFCRRWGVAEFSLFGSVLRDDFRDDSDVDVLVAFKAGSRPEADGWDAMELELRELFGRDVDLVEKGWIENPFRRRHIMTHRRVLYAA